MTVLAGKRRDAHIDFAVVDFDIHTSVEGQAVFHNVHLSHDLDARGQHPVQRARYFSDLEKFAIDAEAKLNSIGTWLDVDIACAHSNGV